mmetsp:Transcript_41071/g.102600  ORF Transcript_41071/g.102600 Transcript_41071/m.102600 type:complete len:80 (-) Transcript_41071:247-486(-)
MFALIDSAARIDTISVFLSRGGQHGEATQQGNALLDVAAPRSTPPRKTTTQTAHPNETKGKSVVRAHPSSSQSVTRSRP